MEKKVGMMECVVSGKYKLRDYENEFLKVIKGSGYEGITYGEILEILNVSEEDDIKYRKVLIKARDNGWIKGLKKKSKHDKRKWAWRL